MRTKQIMSRKNTKEPKRRILLALAVLGAAVLIIMSQVVKNRGGLNVKCSVDYPVSERIVSYRQDDERWKDIHLGDSKYTMESSGCITTCIETAFSEQKSQPNPEQLVALIDAYRLRKTLAQCARVFLHLLQYPYISR